MKTTVSFGDFVQAFKDMGRDKQFTYDGLGVLFQYLEDYEEITKEEIELDVVAICCDFTEDTWQNIAESYSIDLTDAELGGEKYEIVKNYLYDQGALVGEVDGGFVYRNDF